MACGSSLATYVSYTLKKKKKKKKKKTSKQSLYASFQTTQIKASNTRVASVSKSPEKTILLLLYTSHPVCVPYLEYTHPELKCTGAIFRRQSDNFCLLDVHSYQRCLGLVWINALEWNLQGLYIRGKKHSVASRS